MMVYVRYIIEACSHWFVLGHVHLYGVGVEDDVLGAA